nr:hypothetical protein [Evansella caseinilytica]
MSRRIFVEAMLGEEETMSEADAFFKLAVSGFLRSQDDNITL